MELTSPAAASDQPFDQPDDGPSRPLASRARFVLSFAGILCFVLFWMAGRWFDIPAFRGFSASVLDQPRAAAVIFILTTLFAASTALGGVIGCRVRREAGLFTACIGLAAISLRGGTIDRVLLYSAGARRIYLLLALETAVLALLLIVGWLVVHAMQRVGMLRSQEWYDHVHDGESPRTARFWAVAVQTAATAVFVLLLAQSTDKMQVMIGVFLASLGASLTARWMFPVGDARWFLAGPVLCGIIGYLFASFQDPALLLLGKPATNLAAPLPLDYLSVGSAGALAGYWISRHWQAEREAEQA